MAKNKITITVEREDEQTHADIKMVAMCQPIEVLYMLARAMGIAWQSAIRVINQYSDQQETGDKKEIRNRGRALLDKIVLEAIQESEKGVDTQKPGEHCAIIDCGTDKAKAEKMAEKMIAYIEARAAEHHAETVAPCKLVGHRVPPTSSSLN